MMLVLLAFLHTSHVVCGHSEYGHLIYASKHNINGPTVYLHQRRFQQCTKECDSRPACAGFSYANRLNLCLLKTVGPAEVNTTSELIYEPGFVFAKKPQEQVHVTIIYFKKNLK